LFRELSYGIFDVRQGGVDIVSTNEEKQIARQRRERKFRLWLTTLSWTMPIIAFGSFFSIWHNVAAAVNPSAPSGHNINDNSSQAPISPSKSKPNVSAGTNHVLWRVGSRGPQVSRIQEQLHELGYFNHAITEYYGVITAQAVKAFQMDQGLKVTGEVDIDTLNALKHAVKIHQASSLVRSSASSSSESNNVASQSTPSTHHGDSGNVTTSQQIIPQTRSSASGR
jgi:hypothetical protein